MQTLGDFIPDCFIPNRPGFPVAESPAMIHNNTVIAEGALSFYFFNYMTREHIPLEDVDRLEFLCDKFVEYLEDKC